MVFENKEAEEYYWDLVEKYGYFHLNCDEAISIKELDESINLLLKVSESSGNKTN